MSAEQSYSQILRSSSIVGGAAGVTLLLGMVRTKVAAIFLGPAGMGLMVGFAAIYGFIGIVFGLGIQPSAVREISASIALSDVKATARLILTLRRVCWLTGLVGMAAMMALSPLLSRFTFGSEAYAMDIYAISIVVLLNNMSEGHLALLKSMRRINDLALANVLSAVLATLTALAFYSWLGSRGIVPLLISVAAIRLIITFYFESREPVAQVPLSWRQTFIVANGMFSMGLVFMWSSLLSGAVSYITIFLINRWINLQTVGIYSAAFTLSGLFVNFILSAMEVDYYPRLASVTSDKAAVNRLANEQTEMGLLLAVPGLLATLVIAPLILDIFYTHEFIGAVDLLHWFVLGCLGRLISWPLGFMILALGKGRLFLVTETSFHIIHIALVIILMMCFGSEGVAIAYFFAYLAYIIVIYAACNCLTGFSWSDACRKIGCYVALVTGVVFLICRNLPVGPSTLVGLTFILGLSVFCIRHLLHLLKPDHYVAQLISKLPGAEVILNPKERDSDPNNFEI